eukprot:PhF_6_TR5603/c0_g1_i7/m.8073
MSSVTNLEYLVYLNETLGPKIMKWGEDEIDPSWDVIHLPPPPPPCMGDGTYFPRSSEHVDGFWILPAHVVLQLYFTHCAHPSQGLWVRKEAHPNIGPRTNPLSCYWYLEVTV